MTFEDADLANWRAAADVNIWGSLQMVKAVLPTMKAQGDGRIVNIVTQGVEWVLPTFGAYSGSKATLAHFAELHACEPRPVRGARKQRSHPGPIWAPALQGYLQSLADGRGVDTQVVYDEWAAETALKYLVPPEDITGTVVYLASDLSPPRHRPGDLHRRRPVVPLRSAG